MLANHMCIWQTSTVHKFWKLFQKEFWSVFTIKKNYSKYDYFELVVFRILTFFGTLFSISRISQTDFERRKHCFESTSKIVIISVKLRFIFVL